MVLGSGRLLHEGLVWASGVVVSSVVAQHSPQMRVTENQYSVEALIAYRSDAPLRGSIGVRSPHRGMDDMDLLRGKDRVENLGEL